MKIHDFCREYARAYLDHLGWSVIPIRAGSKQPAQRWATYQKQRPSERDMRRWAWENIAVVTGRISNLVVIDEDDLSVLSEKDRAIAEDFLKKLPETATSVTSKGSHRFYRLTDETGLVGQGNALSVDSRDTVPSRVRFLPGIDCRGEGGYVLVPPSLHPSGHVYAWADGHAPSDPADITVLPEWVAETIRKSDLISKWLPASEIARGAKAGARNDTAAKYIGTVLAGKHPDFFEDQWEAVKAWNQRLSPPLALSELRTVFDSIAKRELSQTALRHPELGEVREPSAEAFGDAADLVANPPAQALHIIPGILPVGFATLVGKPKTGKSYLAMQFAGAVALGHMPFKGFKPAVQGHVLYLALEDSMSRFSHRLISLLGPNSTEKLQKMPGAFKIFTEYPQMFEGGLDRLTKALENDPNLRLIVIDTLAAFAGSNGAKRGESAFNSDYRVTRPLFDLAKKYDVAILIVHHARKDVKGATDPFDSVAGTLGTSATADTLLLLTGKYRPGKDKPQYILLGKSREFEEFEYPLKRHGSCWVIGKENFVDEDDE